MTNRSQVNWISLSDAKSGFVFCVTHSLPFPGRWSWITECVAQEFECDADDLDCEEGENGNDFVTLNGERLAEIHNCYMRGNVAGRVPMAEAAE